jgi:Uma2 family endonuclease
MDENGERRGVSPPVPSWLVKGTHSGMPYEAATFSREAQPSATQVDDRFYETQVMSAASTDAEIVLCLESAGILMTPEEFDAVEEYDECYTYELIHGVLVVNSFPGPEEAAPNELLGYLLWDYRERDSRGHVVDETLPLQYVRTSIGRRIANRLIWVGLGRTPNSKRDHATIAVEFVSAGRRNRQRDYEEKRHEYGASGIREYWIFDRFRRTLTVVTYTGPQETERVIQEAQTYESLLLPGFVIPLGRILAAADRLAEA